MSRSRLLPLLFCVPLLAQAPQTGLHRQKVGSLEVVSLLDGEIRLEPGLLADLAPAEVARLVPAPAPTPVNAFLVRTGGHLVLVDTGYGAGAQPGTGRLAEHLRQAGVAPESIEAVLITHAHGDHIGGLLDAKGGRAFPRAVVRIAQAEVDHWMDPATEAALPAAWKPMVAHIKAAFAPYRKEGAFRPFKAGEAPFEGVRALAAPGHTPGHTVYAFGTGAHQVWMAGDLIHFGQVQFEHPEATVVFDTDRPGAARSRADFWGRASREGALVAGAHLAFPGVGRIEASGKAFTWVPVP